MPRVRGDSVGVEYVRQQFKRCPQARGVGARQRGIRRATCQEGVTGEHRVTYEQTATARGMPRGHEHADLERPYFERRPDAIKILENHWACHWLTVPSRETMEVSRCEDGVIGTTYPERYARPFGDRCCSSNVIEVTMRRDHADEVELSRLKRREDLAWATTWINEERRLLVMHRVTVGAPRAPSDPLNNHRQPGSASATAGAAMARSARTVRVPMARSSSTKKPCSSTNARRTAGEGTKKVVVSPW